MKEKTNEIMIKIDLKMVGTSVLNSIMNAKLCVGWEWQGRKTFWRCDEPVLGPMV